MKKQTVTTLRHILAATTACALICLAGCTRHQYVNATYTDFSVEANQISEAGGMLSNTTQAQKRIMTRGFTKKYLNKYVRWERGKICSVEKSESRRDYWCLVRMYSTITFGLLDAPTVGCYVSESEAAVLRKGQAVTLDGRIAEIHEIGKQATPFIVLDPVTITKRDTTRLSNE